MEHEPKHFMLSKDVSEWLRPRIDWNLVPADMRSIVPACIDGDRGLTFEEIMKLSKAVHIPSGNFLLSSAPCDEDHELFKDYNGIPSRAFISTVYHMERCLDIVSTTRHMMCGRIDSDPLASYDEAFSILLETMKENGGVWDYVSLVDAIEQNSVIVLQNGCVDGDTDFMINPLEVSAFCLYQPDVSVIFINGLANRKTELLLKMFAAVKTGKTVRIPGSEGIAISDKYKCLEGIESGPFGYGFSYTRLFAEMVRFAYESCLIKPTDAYRLMCMDNVYDFLDMCKELRHS